MFNLSFIRTFVKRNIRERKQASFSIFRTLRTISSIFSNLRIFVYHADSADCFGNIDLIFRLCGPLFQLFSYFRTLYYYADFILFCHHFSILRTISSIFSNLRTFVYHADFADCFGNIYLIRRLCGLFRL